MSDVKDWNKYFNEVFNGAWDVYSSAEDEPYKQWVKIGARWATDFQNDLLSDLNFEIEAKNAYKNKIQDLKSKLNKAVEALEFYANPKQEDGDRAYIYGYEARQALKEINEK